MDAKPSAESAARLVVDQGPEPDKTFTLGGAPQTIGRSANNGIVINDPEISRRHAQITPQGDGYVVEDLGSTNGTFINGIRLDQPAFLKHGDRLEFGDTVRLRFWAAGRPAEIVRSPAEDIPTPALPSSPAPVYEPPDPLPQASPAGPSETADYFESQEPPTNNHNRMLIGCGCLLVVACLLCVGGVVALDSYDQGRLLYCGGLRPFWETVLGPLGFNPICP